MFKESDILECINPSTSQGKKESSGGSILRTKSTISSTKLEALMSDLRLRRSMDEENRKTSSGVIFSQFTGFLDLIEPALQRDGFRLSLSFSLTILFVLPSFYSKLMFFLKENRYVRLDGSLSTKARTVVLKSFNEPIDEGCLLLCSLKVAGVGLNLVKANRVYMMDTWWNAAIEGLFGPLFSSLWVGEKEKLENHVFLFLFFFSFSSFLVDFRSSNRVEFLSFSFMSKSKHSFCFYFAGNSVEYIDSDKFKKRL